MQQHKYVGRSFKRIQSNAVVILSFIIFFVLHSFTLPLHSIWLLLFYISALGFLNVVVVIKKTAIYLKANTPHSRCGLHASLFHDFRRMCFKCSALKWLNDRAHLVCIRFICVPEKCKTVLYYSAMHRTGAL